MGVHTELNVLEEGILSSNTIRDIYDAAQIDCESKMIGLLEGFDKENYDFEYDIICRVIITPKE